MPGYPCCCNKPCPACQNGAPDQIQVTLALIDEFGDPPAIDSCGSCAGFNGVAYVLDYDGCDQDESGNNLPFCWYRYTFDPTQCAANSLVAVIYKNGLIINVRAALIATTDRGDLWFSPLAAWELTVTAEGELADCNNLNVTLPFNSGYVQWGPPRVAVRCYPNLSTAEILAL